MSVPDDGAVPRSDQLAVYSRTLSRCNALVHALREQVLLVLEGPETGAGEAEHAARLRRCDERVALVREQYEESLRQSVAAGR